MTQPRATKRSAAANTPSPIDTLPFEDAFSQMQVVITQLERGELPLDQTIAAFERGMQLAKRCNALLDAAQLRVQVLESEDGASLTLHDVEVES